MHQFMQKHLIKVVRLAQAFVLVSMGMLLMAAIEHVVFPFVTTKVWFFQTFIAVAFALYVVVLLFDRKYLPRPSLLSSAIALFLFATLISVYAGVDSVRSLWSVHERMLGWVNMAHFVAFYILILGLFRTKKERMFLMVWFLLLSIPNSIVVMIQKRVPGFFLSNSDRPVGLLGNAIYVSFFGVYVMAFAALTFDYMVRAYKKNRDRAKKWITYGYVTGASVAVIAAALAGIAASMSNSRSTTLGLAAMVVWATSVVAVASASKKVRKGALTLLILMGLLVSIVVIGNKSPALAEAPFVGRFANFSLATGSNDNRLFAWRVGIEGFKERPLFGWGLYNYSFIFNKYFEGNRLQSDTFNESWFDNAHNFYIDIAATGGVVGLASYLSIFIAALYLCYRGWQSGRLRLFEATVLSSLIVFHAVQNLFVFEHLISYINFFLLLGLIASFSGRARQVSRPPLKNVTIIASIVVTLVITAGVIYKANVVQYQANRYMYTGLHALYSTGNAGPWYSDFKKAMALPTPHTDHIIEEMARALLGANIPAELVTPELREMAVYVVDGLQDSIDKHDFDVINRMLLAEMWFFLGEFFPNEYPDAFELADQHFTAAVDKSPERQQVLLNWSIHLARIGKWEEARNIILKTRGLSPTVAVVADHYQFYLQSTGQHRSAIKHLAVIMDFNRRPPTEYEENALDYYNFIDKQRGVKRLSAYIACSGVDVPALCPQHQIWNPDAITPRLDTFDKVIEYYQDKDQAVAQQYEQAKERYYPQDL